MSNATSQRLNAAAAPVFAALGDATRLAIVARLCKAGPQSITRLTDHAAITRQAITKHLHVLAEAGLIRDTQHGRERIWELEPKSLAKAQNYLAHVSEQWDAAIGRLRQFLDEQP